MPGFSVNLAKNMPNVQICFLTNSLSLLKEYATDGIMVSIKQYKWFQMSQSND